MEDEAAIAADANRAGSSAALDSVVSLSGLPESAPVRALFTELNSQGVRYCHWKSNIRLDRTLAGKEDIDILVHPLDAGLLLDVIAATGFKFAMPARGVGHPSVFHATALDRASGELVDLHGYHQLVSGDSLVKAFRFPIEERLLANLTVQSGVAVPAPAAELVLFLVRTLLKHTSLFEIILVNRKYEQTCEELAWLLDRASREEAARICRDWIPTLSVSLEQMIACVSRPDAVLQRVRLGRRVARDVRGWRRLGGFSAQVSRLERMFSRLVARFRPRRGRSLLAGGAWFAFVGPKGTGKTTLARMTAESIGKQLDVMVVHVGKPPATLLSFVPRLFLAPARRAWPSERLSEYERPERRAKGRYSLVYVVRKYLLAHDRQRLLARILRATTAGKIVLSDRCPVTNSTGVDGSAFDDLAIARAPSPLHRWLMQKERRIYRVLPRPRMVLKLTADVGTAVLRDSARKKRGGPDADAIRRRWALESLAEFDGSEVSQVDASGTREDTLRECVSRVWGAL